MLRILVWKFGEKTKIWEKFIEAFFSNYIDNFLPFIRDQLYFDNIETPPFVITSRDVTLYQSSFFFIYAKVNK